MRIKLSVQKQNVKWNKNRDDIIRKLFERSLEPKERGELNNYEFINDALRKQWEEAPAIVDSVREESYFA